MAIKHYIKTLTIRDKSLIISLLVFYVAGIALSFGFWGYFERWNYLVSLYLDRPLHLFLYAGCGLLSLVLLVFSNRLLIKLLALAAFMFPALLLVINLLIDPHGYGPPQAREVISSPDGKAKVIVYLYDEWMSTADMVVVVQRSGQFFPKTLYVGDTGILDEIQWLDNKRIRLTVVKKGFWYKPSKSIASFTKLAYIPEKHYDVTEDSPTIIMPH